MTRSASISFGVLSVLAAFCVQPSITGAETVQPAMEQDAKETRDETVAKCLIDLQSDDPASRKRAVLILGKYDDPRALAALGRALLDPETAVRRAALVSLVENDDWPGRVAPLVLRLLNDPDVHIRRIASSVLPRLIQGYRRWRADVDKSDDEAGAGLHEEIDQAIRDAFGDEDAVVRENMLSNYYFFFEYLTPELLRPLLADPNRDVRILALQPCIQIFPKEELVDIARRLVQDPDPLIRAETARMLAHVHKPAAETILQKMTRDSKTRVVAEATLALLELGKRPADVDLSRVLAAADLDPSLASRIVRELPNLGHPAKSMLHALFDHEQAGVRATAFHAYANGFAAGTDPTMLLPYLGDASERVRAAVLHAVTRAAPLSGKSIRDLARSPYADVRRYGASATQALSQAAAQEILMELLLDEASIVRGEAIRDIAQRRLPGWLPILKRSLQDTDADIRRHAVLALAGTNTPAARAILRDYARETGDEALKNMIEGILAASESAPSSESTGGPEDDK